MAERKFHSSLLLLWFEPRPTLERVFTSRAYINSDQSILEHRKERQKVWKFDLKSSQLPVFIAHRLTWIALDVCDELELSSACWAKSEHCFIHLSFASLLMPDHQTANSDHWKLPATGSEGLLLLLLLISILLDRSEADRNRARKCRHIGESERERESLFAQSGQRLLLLVDLAWAIRRWPTFDLVVVIVAACCSLPILFEV